MDVEPRGRLRRWFGGIRRFPSRHPVATLLLLFFGPIGLAGLFRLVAGAMGGRSIGDAGLTLLLVSSPALLVGVIWYAVRGVQRLVTNRRAKRFPMPSGPPIERIARDLRRLLWEHDDVVRSDNVMLRTQRLWALEAAISERAIQAARALQVPYGDRPTGPGLNTSQLRRLLRALAAEGLVLPSTVGLLAPDSRS